MSQDRVPIRIAYDIGILSRLRDCGVPETGLARASRQTLDALLKDPRVEVMIVSCEAPFSAMRICRESGWQNQFKVPGGILTLLLLNAVFHIDNLISRISPAASLPLRILKSILFRLSYLLRKLPISPISPEILCGFDIYHSSFLKLPQEAFAVSECIKVLFVHDVIAIHHPQWFEVTATRGLREIIASLTPECAVITNSEFTRKDFARTTNFPIDRVFVAPLAADQRLFFPCQSASEHLRIRKKIGLGENQPFLLSLCTLEPRKNLANALASWALARSKYQHDDLAIVLAGSVGWRQEDFSSLLDSFGEARNFIHIPGFIDDEDLAPLYSTASAFLYLSKYEGFGLPPLEAMQCGTPVIASNLTSIPEVVGEAGILVDPEDIEQIALEIESLLRSPNRSDKLKASAVERARSFSWQHCATECINSYIKIIS